MISILGVVCLAQTVCCGATRVVAWGRNTEGQTNVPPDLTNAVAVAAGGYHCLALNADRTGGGLGQNGFRQKFPPPGVADGGAIPAGGVFARAADEGCG